eukprot:2836446-Amphidinium_carterae.1
MSDTAPPEIYLPPPPPSKSKGCDVLKELVMPDAPGRRPDVLAPAWNDKFKFAVATSSLTGHAQLQREPNKSNK